MKKTDYLSARTLRSVARELRARGYDVSGASLADTPGPGAFFCNLVSRFRNSDGADGERDARAAVRLAAQEAK